MMPSGLVLTIHVPEMEGRWRRWKKGMEEMGWIQRGEKERRERRGDSGA